MQYNRIFGILMFVFSLQISVSLSINHWTYVYSSVYYKYFYILYQTAFIIGPLIYFYVKSVSDINYRFKKKELLHFLPFILIVIPLIVLLFVYHLKFKFTNSRFGIVIHSLIYIILSFNYIKKRGLKLNSFINLNNAENLIKFILICYILLWVVNLQVFAIVKFRLMSDWCPYVRSIYALSAFVFINSVAFWTLYKPELFILKQKYAKSNLEPEQKNSFYDEILHYINTHKPYLEPELTLSKLSEAMNIPSKCISQVINEKQKQNFNDFINTFRVEESKQYLCDNSKARLTIQEIFYKSGFNSKSTFNLVFKKHTGMTPTEFKEKSNR